MKVHERINAYIAANGIATDALSNRTGIPKDRLGAMLSGKETLYAKDLRRSAWHSMSALKYL